MDEILDRMSALLSRCGEPRWAQATAVLAERWRDSPTESAERQVVVQEVLGMFGGMGSLTDLVLQTSKGVLVEENTVFGRLRRELFDAAVASKQRSGSS